MPTRRRIDWALILSCAAAAGAHASDWRREMALARTWDDVMLARRQFCRELAFLARLAREEENATVLIRALSEIARNNPEDVEARLDLAMAQLSYGFPAAARKTFLAVLKIDPEEIRALRSLAALAADEGEAKEASVLLRRADGAKPSDERAHYDAARYFLRQRTETEARAEFLKVLAIYPNNSGSDRSALSVLARDALSNEDYNKAAAYYARILQYYAVRPTTIQNESWYRMEYQFCRGMALEKQGDEVRAGQGFDAAMREAADSMSRMHQLGQLFFEKRMYRRAATAYERALRLRPPGKLLGYDKDLVEEIQRRLEVTRQLTRLEKPRRRISEADQRRLLSPFGKVLWVRKDPYGNARWAAVDGAFVWLDSAESLQIEPFAEFRAAWGRPIHAAAIAFSQKQVWVATDIGLMCFDRALKQWTQRVVGGGKADSPVDSVQCANGRVAARVGQKRYTLDAASGQWELDKPK